MTRDQAIQHATEFIDNHEKTQGEIKGIIVATEHERTTGEYDEVTVVLSNTELYAASKGLTCDLLSDGEYGKEVQ